MHNNSIYQARIFHPELAQHSAKGSLRFDGLYLLFFSPEIELKLPLQGLQLREGGSDDLIFFSHPNVEHCEICTQDHRVLQEPILLKTPALAAQVQKINHKSLKLWGLLAATMLVLVLSSWGVMTGFSSLAQVVVKNIPPEWEKNLGAAGFAHIQQEQTVLQSPELEQQLKNFTGKLTSTIKDSRYPFQIAVVNNPVVNAFALPGGYIIINSGLIAEATQGEEVLGVLAHEIAHVTRQHGLQNMVKSAGIYLTAQALFGDSGGLLQILTEAAPMLLTQKYSRDFEREADQVGLEYLIAAHINPAGMVSFFQKLQQTYKNTPQESLEHSLNLLSTHPATSDRIAELQAQLADFQIEHPQKLDKDFQHLKQVLAQTQP